MRYQGLFYIFAVTLLIPWSLQSPVPSEIFQPVHPEPPPFCTKVRIIKSTLSHSAGQSSLRTIIANVQIDLDNTACFRITRTSDNPEPDNDFGTRVPKESWIHSLKLTQLEQHHPISEYYKFAIPEVSISCICDCNQASEVCTSTKYSFKRCRKSNSSSDVSCYRTYSSIITDAGCPPGSHSQQCCEITLKPYKNTTYMAVKLEQPTTFAVFKYIAYDYSAGRWIARDRSTIRVEIDGRTQSRYLDVWKTLELSVSGGGGVSKKLESGMYFARSNPGGEMDELRRQSLNELNQNDPNRLGWYREDSRTGRFDIPNGEVMLNGAHQVEVINCKEQRTRSFLDAQFWINKDDPEGANRVALESTVERIFTWVKSAKIVDGSARQAIVVHSQGTHLDVALQLHDSNRHLSFLHDSSKLGDFSGTVIVDFKSNRYFNLTTYDSGGIIHGIVHRTTDIKSPEDFSFTTYIDDFRSPNKTVIVPLPAMVDKGDRMICLRVDFDFGQQRSPENEVCRVIPFREDPLEINLLDNTWRELESQCPECNKLSMTGFLNNLNPLNWANGIGSLSNFIMMASDILIYIVVGFIAYFFITRCLIPICRCSVCPAQSLFSCYKKSRKQTKRRKASEFE